MSEAERSNFNVPMNVADGISDVIEVKAVISAINAERLESGKQPIETTGVLSMLTKTVVENVVQKPIAGAFMPIAEQISGRVAKKITIA